MEEAFFPSSCQSPLTTIGARRFRRARLNHVEDDEKQLQTLPCTCLWTGIKVSKARKRGDRDRLGSDNAVPGWPLVIYTIARVGGGVELG